MEFTFLLKKIVSMFIMPLPIVIILGLIGLIFLYKNSIKKAKIFLTSSFTLLVFISSISFADFLLKPLESQYKTLKVIPSDVKYILLLGGDRYARAWEALRLYHIIANSKIITSGYSFKGKISGANKTAKLLIDSGVKKDDIIINSTPKDTKEEALLIKKMLKNEKFILITSAYHMPRSLQIFNSAGLYPIVSATDYLIKPNDRGLSFINGYDAYRTSRAWHEYVGLLYNKIKN